MSQTSLLDIESLPTRGTLHSAKINMQVKLLDRCSNKPFNQRVGLAVLARGRQLPARDEQRDHLATMCLKRPQGMTLAPCIGDRDYLYVDR